MPKVLVFDSGVGGLSVYQQIQQRFPQLNYIYLFDNAGYPYGELEPETLIKRVKRFVQHVVEKENIDMVVIACNTASTIVLPHLRSILSIPVVGVVPAIKPAAALAEKAVGLIATPATVNRPYTHDLIKQFAPNVDVKLLGSTRLVTMAEEKLRGQSIDLTELDEILLPLKEQIDVAVLGCTHFPLLREEVQQVLGQRVKLVDSGAAIAARVGSLLKLETQPMSETAFPYAIYSSATPWEDVALNKGLKQFGFSPVQTLPPLDV
ncbi:MAG: glutamate racemase [Vibrio sp.]